jgi:hypothetical protein
MGLGLVGQTDEKRLQNQLERLAGWEKIFGKEAKNVSGVEQGVLLP